MWLSPWAYDIFGVFLFKFTSLYVGLRHGLIHLLSHSLHTAHTERFPALAEAWLTWRKIFLLGSSTSLGLVWAGFFWPFQLKYEVTFAERLQLLWFSASSSWRKLRVSPGRLSHSLWLLSNSYTCNFCFVLFGDSAEVPFSLPSSEQSSWSSAVPTEWVGPAEPSPCPLAPLD